MERTTKTITTTGGHTVVVHDFITGREQRKIQDVFLRNAEIKAGTEITGFKASAAAEAQDVALGLVVVSFDGSTENVVDKVLDLPANETAEILAVVNEVTEGKKK